MDLMSIALTGGIAVIGYFLKQTMEDLKKTKEVAYDVKNKLAVIENDYLNKHAHLSDKFDELYGAVKDLTTEIKQLTKEINKKKDI
jgi:uncharacterized protein YoxC